MELCGPAEAGFNRASPSSLEYQAGDLPSGLVNLQHVGKKLKVSGFRCQGAKAKTLKPEH
jgi:hypothetical protein